MTPAGTAAATPWMEGPCWACWGAGCTPRTAPASSASGMWTGGQGGERAVGLLALHGRAAGCKRWPLVQVWDVANTETCRSWAVGRPTGARNLLAPRQTAPLPLRPCCQADPPGGLHRGGLAERLRQHGRGWQPGGARAQRRQGERWWRAEACLLLAPPPSGPCCPACSISQPPPRCA